MDGCYAEYFRAEAAFATPVPAGIDPREAAPLTWAGVTTYKAVKVGNVPARRGPDQGELRDQAAGRRQ